jgi:hypothetical protein
MFHGGFSLLRCAHKPGAHESASTNANNPRHLVGHPDLQNPIAAPNPSPARMTFRAFGITLHRHAAKGKSPSAIALGRLVSNVEI